MSTMEGSTDKVAEKSTKPLGMRKNGTHRLALRFTVAGLFLANTQIYKENNGMH